MDIQRIRGALAGSRFADLRWVAETGSTNDDLVALAREGQPAGIVLVAEHQSAGRGRLGRTWTAPPGSSLLVSILTRPSAPPLALDAHEMHMVSGAVGLAAAEAVRSVTGVDVRLKWPNDLVVDRDGETRKLSGILAESIIEGSLVAALVIGIGINVNWPTDIPADLAQIAVALNHLTGESVDRTNLLVEFLQRLDSLYTDLATYEGRTALVERSHALSATIGRRVRVDLASESFEGDAVDINELGQLLVVGRPGEAPRAITTGDVVHLRALA